MMSSKTNRKWRKKRIEVVVDEFTIYAGTPRELQGIANLLRWEGRHIHQDWQARVIEEAINEIYKYVA